MSFNTPTFNLTCNVWNLPNHPFLPPSLTPACNLAFGKRFHPYGAQTSETFMQLLLPPGTDIRCVVQAAGGSWVEVPSGSGRFYQTVFVDDVAKGFPNEFRVAVLKQTTGFGFWPSPMP